MDTERKKNILKIKKKIVIKKNGEKLKKKYIKNKLWKIKKKYGKKNCEKLKKNLWYHYRNAFAHRNSIRVCKALAAQVNIKKVCRFLTTEQI